MSQPRELTQVALDHLASRIQAANEAREQAKQLIAFAEEQEQIVKDEMGDAEQATVFGVPVFTYAWKDSYALARFKNDHPHIARNYMVTETREVLDKDRLLAEQGDVVRQYQTREFRRVSRAA